MQFSFLLAFALIGSTVVESAPTAALDAATLLQNGQQALELNNQFQNLTLADSCTTGQTACIQGAIAQCTNGAWSIASQCQQTQQCFALPSVRSAGVNLVCTSEASALSLIEATGATNNANDSGTGSNGDGDNGGSSNNGSGTNSSNGPFDPFISTQTSTPTSGVVFVTVTVTANPSQTTLPPVTQTLSPAEASIALSSLLAAGGSTATSSGTGYSYGYPDPTSLPSSSVPLPTGITAAAPPSGTSASVILLTAASVSSATGAVAASVPTSSTSDASGGGYAYGGY